MASIFTSSNIGTWIKTEDVILKIVFMLFKMLWNFQSKKLIFGEHSKQLYYKFPFSTHVTINLKYLIMHFVLYFGIPCYTTVPYE